MKDLIKNIVIVVLIIITYNLYSTNESLNYENRKLQNTINRYDNKIEKLERDNSRLSASIKELSTNSSYTTTTSQSSKTESTISDYILNKNTKKFHKPYCSSVSQMKESNKEYFTGERDEVISKGYSPCQRCYP